jgi:RNA polymerase sigma-70 factor (ECF subfamily)
VDDADRHARLEDWFRAYGDRVLAYLLHRTDSDTAQDVLQEVFVIAFRKANVVPEPAIGWLLATARRVLANAHRGARRREQLTVRLTEQSEPSAQVGHTAEDDSSVAVAEALARVSPADREVLTLSAWYELTTDEAAAALGCSRSAYSVRLHRARRRLAERLATAGFPTPSRLTEAVNE